MILPTDLSILFHLRLTSDTKEEAEFGAYYDGEEILLLLHCPVVDRELIFIIFTE